MYFCSNPKTMKKENTKSMAKQDQETTKKSIKTGLVTELKAFAAKLGHNSKKIEKEIEKAAKNLAKKLSKPAEADKVAKTPKIKAVKVTPVIKAVKTPKPVVADKKEKAPIAAPAPAKKETPAKPVVVKEAAPKTVTTKKETAAKPTVVKKTGK